MDFMELADNLGLEEKEFLEFVELFLETSVSDLEEVKQFVRMAFYRRFGLSPDPEFVELRPGGGALGVRLTRYDCLPQLIGQLHLLPANASEGN